MKIMELTEDGLPIVLEMCDDKIGADLKEAFELSKMTGGMLFVRFAPGWVQWLPVDASYQNYPGFRETIMQDSFWEVGN